MNVLNCYERTNERTKKRTKKQTNKFLLFKVKQQVFVNVRRATLIVIEKRINFISKVQNQEKKPHGIEFYLK